MNARSAWTLVPSSRAVLGLACAAAVAACPGPPAVPPELADAGLDAGPPAGRDAGPVCPFGTLPTDFCAPEPPRGTPEADCPSGAYLADAGFGGRGLCLPAAARSTPAQECPSGLFLPDPAFEDGRGVCLPEAPRLVDWSCPTHWQAVPLFADEAGAANPPQGVAAAKACAPPDLKVCPAPQMYSLASGDCVALGEICPAGGADAWAEESTLRSRAPGFSGAVHYVKAGAAAGGTGSRAAPFAGVAEALAAATDGDVVALSAGDFPASLVVARSLAVLGACAGGTRLVPASGSTAPVLEISGAGPALVQDLEIAGPGPGLWLHGRDGETRLESLRFAQASSFALHVEGGAGTARAHRLLLDGLVDDASTQAALLVDAGGKLEVSDLAVEAVHGTAVRVADAGSRLRGADLLVRGTTLRSTDSDARGLSVALGASAELERVALVDGKGIAILAGEAGTDLRLTDLHVARTGPRGDGMLGRGAVVQAGAAARFERALFTDGREVGLLAAEGAAVELSDALFRGTGANASGLFGDGMRARDAATVTGARVVLDRNLEAGVSLFGEGTLVRLTDFVVRDTRPTPDGWLGRGASAEDAAALELARGAVLQSRETAVYAGAAGTKVALADVAIVDTSPQEGDGKFGNGAEAKDGAALSLTRVLVDRASYVGVSAWDAGSTLALTDLVVRDTRTLADGRWGRGLAVEGGAAAAARRALLSGNSDMSVTCSGAGSSLELTDAVVADTRSLPDGTFGGGAGFADLSRGSLDRVSISDSGYVGLFADTGASLAARDVRVSGVRGEAGGRLGRGLECAAQTTFTGARVLVERCREVGLFALGAAVTATDLAVREVSASAGGGYGRGLQLSDGPVAFARLLVEDSADAALFVSNATTTVSLEDVVLRATRSTADLGQAGNGLLAQLGASVTLSRALLDGNRDVALLANTAGTRVDASALVVRGTADAACHLSTCSGGGTAVSVFAGAQVSLADFVLEESSLVGLQVGEAGGLGAAHGLLLRNLVGVNVADPAYDFGRLDDVRVFENGVDLASEVIPVPAAGALVGR